MIAAEMLHLQAFMVDIDPAYCDVIRQRYSDYVGDQSYALHDFEPDQPTRPRDPATKRNLTGEHPERAPREPCYRHRKTGEGLLP